MEKARPDLQRPFQDRYVDAIQATRVSRLGDVEREEMAAIMPVIEGCTGRPRKAFNRFSELLTRTGTFDPLPEDL